MALSREIVVPGLIAENQAFAELLRTLDADEWQRPTRCEGWTVADIAAHVTGTLTDVVNLRLDGLGTPEVTQREVDERRGRTPPEIADELEQSTKLGADLLGGFDDAAWEGPAPAGVQGSLGFGVETLWYDTYVHADDIRAAVGRPSVRSAGLRPSLSHIAQVLTDQKHAPMVLALDGLDVPEEFTVSGGGGKRVTGDALEFVLAATGRGDPKRFGFDETLNIYRS